MKFHKQSIVPCLTQKSTIALTKSFSNWQNPMANRFFNCLGLVMLDLVWLWIKLYKIPSDPTLPKLPKNRANAKVYHINMAYGKEEKVHPYALWTSKQNKGQMKRTTHFLLWSMTYICMHISRIWVYIFTKHVYKTISPLSKHPEF